MVDEQGPPGVQGGMRIPGVPPVPLPVAIHNSIMRGEDGTVWIVHTIANAGGIAHAWLQINDAVNVMNELADSIKEARDVPKLTIARSMPPTNGEKKI